MSLLAGLQTQAPQPVLALDDVTIAYRGDDGERIVVEGVSFSIWPGEVVALVGESGSGKTTTAQSVIGLLADNGRLARGAIRLNGIDISRWPQKRLDSIRGSVVSLVPQDPGSSLNPVKTIGEQVDEILRLHQNRGDRKAIRQQTLALLARVGLTQPELRAAQYPHELSGGMKQRVLIAIAIALKPALIIADEPTSALDVTVQKRILDLLDDLRREQGTAVLFVTHDLGVAAERADRLLVFRQGYIQEQGPVREVLSAPQSPYTRTLLDNIPSLAATKRPSRRQDGAPIVTVEHLVQEFPLAGKTTPFRAVDDISFSVAPGTTHAIVGESGSGKTTTARLLLGFQRPTAGRIVIDGTDIAPLRGEALRQFRQHIQLVYQNPFSSLDPAQRLADIVEEPLRNFGRYRRLERQQKVAEMFERVALPASLLQRYPAELSGGQRQRVAIARALVLEPKVLVLDEAVSALDVTVQAQILRLLEELQTALGLTYLFISHDLAVVRQIADTVSVLCHGKLVESGPVEQIFSQPEQPYTQALIDAIPGRRALIHA
ncbi:dipeptide ABC transporter ATP-binding protein [Musicola paradisiaca]|uniref:ABC transporter related n=1 Tax=Musicola paradisiaca (strain Ech703) TaxID=579405 RepID=C6C5N4_MUSP7|nr:ABC transporter ATP-binding protein [Musicola paradisiaca]ACS83847.1 ABC transporter related [Musicola paradisiaca Ech703]